MLTPIGRKFKMNIRSRVSRELKDYSETYILESDRILSDGDDKKWSALRLWGVSPQNCCHDSRPPHLLTTPMLPVPLVEGHEYRIKLDWKKLAKINAGLLGKNCVFSTTISNICKNKIDWMIQYKKFCFVLNDAIIVSNKAKIVLCWIIRSIVVMQTYYIS